MSIGQTAKVNSKGGRASVCYHDGILTEATFEHRPEPRVPHVILVRVIGPKV